MHQVLNEIAIAMANLIQGGMQDYYRFPELPTRKAKSLENLYFLIHIF